LRSGRSPRLCSPQPRFAGSEGGASARSAGATSTAAHEDIHCHRDEDHGQVRDRVLEQPHGGFDGPAVTTKAQRVADVEAAGYDGDRPEDDPHVCHGRKEQGHCDESDRVGDDLPRHPVEGSYCRQHRHVGRGVVVPVLDRERPEMGWRPDDDQRKEHYSCPGDAACDRSPADEHGHRAGGSTNDDVLRRAPLQKDRVHKDVEKRRREGKHRRYQVHVPPQHEEGGRLEDAGEHDRLGWSDGTGDERSLAGPLHDGVDVPVEEHVGGIGSPGRKSAPDQGRQHEPGRRQAAARHDHGGKRRDEQELDDTRLRESDETPELAAKGTAPTYDRDSLGHFGHPKAVR